MWHNIRSRRYDSLLFMVSIFVFFAFSLPGMPGVHLFGRLVYSLCRNVDKGKNAAPQAVTPPHAGTRRVRMRIKSNTKLVFRLRDWAVAAWVPDYTHAPGTAACSV